MKRIYFIIASLAVSSSITAQWQSRSFVGADAMLLNDVFEIKSMSALGGISAGQFVTPVHGYRFSLQVGEIDVRKKGHAAIMFGADYLLNFTQLAKTSRDWNFQATGQLGLGMHFINESAVESSSRVGSYARAGIELEYVFRKRWGVSLTPALYLMDKKSIGQFDNSIVAGAVSVGVKYMFNYLSYDKFAEKLYVQNESFWDNMYATTQFKLYGKPSLLRESLKNAVYSGFGIGIGKYLSNTWQVGLAMNALPHSDFEMWQFLVEGGFDVVEAFWQRSEAPRWGVVPKLGVGVANVEGHGTNFTSRAAMQVKFKLPKNFFVFGEGEMDLVKYHENNNLSYLAATLGVGYNINTKREKPFRSEIVEEQELASTDPAVLPMTPLNIDSVDVLGDEGVTTELEVINETHFFDLFFAPFNCYLNKEMRDALTLAAEWLSQNNNNRLELVFYPASAQETGLSDDLRKMRINAIGSFLNKDTKGSVDHITSRDATPEEAAKQFPGTVRVVFK